MFNWIKVALRRQHSKDTLKIDGRAVLTATDPRTGKVVAVIVSKNIVTSVGKYLVGDMLIDESGYDTGLTYCALGADNTAPAVGQTQLVDEGGGAAMRKTITSKSRSGNEITLSTFFTAAECTLAIEEAGIFGHSTAGAAENSGVMFARWLSSFDNSGGLYDLTFDYILTIG